MRFVGSPLSEKNLLGNPVNKPINQPGGYRAEKNLRTVAAKGAAFLRFASSHARLRFNPFPEHGYATAVASISIRMSG